MELRYRLAVVTGGGSGLGRVISVALARRGAAVLVADRDLAAAEGTAGTVRTSRVAAWALQVNLAEEEQVRLLAGRARDLGGADLLINNAGGWTEGSARYPAADPREWRRTVELNLLSPMLLTQLFLDALPAAPGDAAVVNICSDAALGAGGYGSPEYAASKAALVRLTTALADPATAARARVTAVLPGWIGLDRAVVEWDRLAAEERQGLPPLIPPAEVADVVLGLLAEGAAGTVVEMTGGRPPVVRSPA